MSTHMIATTHITSPMGPYLPPSIYGHASTPTRARRTPRTPRPYRPPSMFPRQLDFDNIEVNSDHDRKTTIVLPMCEHQCECTICMTEETEPTPTVGTLPCGHAFHTVCIQQWFMSSNTCPNCRACIDVRSLMQYT